ncbi:putative ATP-dependent RNA helicase [Gorgonomyces haynaldii]|nr:putative ATP-dependent RNA helicase [Gorgonomyces haynaldii]
MSLPKTRREQLRHQLELHRAGLETKDVLVEHVPQTDAPVEEIPIETQPVEEIGIVSRAFGPSTTTDTFSFDGKSTVSNGTQEYKKQTQKRMATGFQMPEISKKPKKEKKVVEKVEQVKWKLNVVEGEKLPNVKPVKSEQKPVKSVPKVSDQKPGEKAYFVPVDRSEDVQLSRVQLPVVGEEQVIMEAVYHNDVVVLCGETGSGKTTQVPQFLYEAGFGDPNHPQFTGMVGVTQPRRVAAIAMSERVRHELNVKDQVAHQVRYDQQTTKNTRIKFMTDGILLRELLNAMNGGDLLLQQYSCIIVDEAHERTIGTDVLIGWLSRICKLRNSNKIKNVKPLKLVIMSATLRVDDFVANPVLFSEKPPVVQVEGRQHKVTVHYNKKTPEMDYVTEAYKKVVKIHSKLPPGGILVFLTGQQEVLQLVQRLSERFPSKQKLELDLESDDDDESKEAIGQDNQFSKMERDDFERLENEMESDDEEEEVHVIGDEDEIEPEEEKMQANSPLHVLPLYSLLPAEKQMKIFEAPPEGTRLVVVATNVAETSLTIPGIRYVVDCGKVKEKMHDPQTSMQFFKIQWASQASCDQRAGRAGRTGPGHCYRLYSSNVFFTLFEKFGKPEILKSPIDSVVLQMKSMGIENVVGFPFPTPPPKEGLIQAQKLLTSLGALESQTPFKITDQGRQMARFPISPRYAKMLVVSALEGNQSILPHTVALVSGLSVGQVFVNEPSEEQEKHFFQIMAMFAGQQQSDMLALLKAVGAYQAEQKRNRDLVVFCKKHFLRPKAMQETVMLMQQLFSILDVKERQLLPPSKEDQKRLKQIILTGYPDHVARLDPTKKSGKLGLPIYQTMLGDPSDEFVIHASSSLYRERPAPAWIVYDSVEAKQETIGITETIETHGNPNKKFLKNVTAIEPLWLGRQQTNFLSRGRILEQPEPEYAVEKDQIVGYYYPTYGPKFWDLGLSLLPLPFEDAVTWFLVHLLRGNIPLDKNVFRELAVIQLTAAQTRTETNHSDKVMGQAKENHGPLQSLLH